jgi:hypothetical protein
MRSSADAVLVACVPGAIAAAERSGHFALARRLFAECAVERTVLPEGYAFRFDAGELGAVSRFVANERRCCPFITFELEIAPAGGPLWLRMTGPEGTRAVLDAELSLSGDEPSGGCGCES